MSSIVRLFICIVNRFSNLLSRPNILDTRIDPLDEYKSSDSIVLGSNAVFAIIFLRKHNFSVFFFPSANSYFFFCDECVKSFLASTTSVSCCGVSVQSTLI